MSDYGWVIKDDKGAILLHTPMWMHPNPHPTDIWWFDSPERAKWNCPTGERVVLLNKKTLEECVGE